MIQHSTLSPSWPHSIRCRRISAENNRRSRRRQRKVRISSEIISRFSQCAVLPTSYCIGEEAMEGDSEMAEAMSPSEHHSCGGGDAVRELLTAARQLIDHGKPSQALQAVVMAMRAKGGDEAVFQFLQRARELYRTRIQSNNAVDQLASLFAECAIAEAQPLNTDPSLDTTAAGQSTNPDAHRDSILAETGRVQIVLDAFADGSSFICLQCGGLVSVHRKDEHYTYWCG